MTCQYAQNKAPYLRLILITGRFVFATEELSDRFARACERRVVFLPQISLHIFVYDLILLLENLVI